MKVSLGIGWFLLAEILAAFAYGWKGAFWVLASWLIYIFGFFPMYALLYKKTNATRAKE